MKEWFQRLFGSTRDSEAKPEPPMAIGKWLAAEDPNNPFDVRLLDLMENLGLLSTTEDPELARRSVSWKAGGHREIEVELKGEQFACELRYPSFPGLPAGLLFRPEEMETKWVIGYRDGRVALARSWTGETVALAQARQEGDQLVLRDLVIAPNSGLRRFGDPVETFDWVMRSHALRARIPLSVSPEGAQLLSEQPTLGFNIHGRQLFCAAIDYPYPPPVGTLYSDGDLARAVATGDLADVRRLLDTEQAVDAPIGFNQGASALHLALYLHPDVAEALVEAGADVNSPTPKGSTPLMAAIAGNAPSHIAERLLAEGANLESEDMFGFRALHVAAQFGNEEGAHLLLATGADIAAKTRRGLTPLHVAAGTGEVAVAGLLLRSGADPTASSSEGDVRAIALAQGHDGILELLDT